MFTLSLGTAGFEPLVSADRYHQLHQHLLFSERTSGTAVVGGNSFKYTILTRVSDWSKRGIAS